MDRFDNDEIVDGVSSKRVLAIHKTESVHSGNIYNNCTTHIHYDSDQILPDSMSQASSASGGKHFSEANIDELKKKLKLIYKQATMPRVHWLPEGKDFLFRDSYIELQQTESTNQQEEKPIKLEELFEESVGVTPKRILVEGQPGFGKTMLANKLTYDWATDQQYLQQYEIVFFIPLRNLKGRSLEEELNSVIGHCHLQKSIGFNDIEGENMLLILDGYDEMDENSIADVTKVLYQLKFDETTVLVTSRSGLFPLKREELQKLFPDFPHMNAEFHHKKINILGIGVENRVQFLNKFCPNADANEMILTFHNLPNDINKMLQSPLLLFLISYFNSGQLNLATSSTLTDLYKSLFNNIVITNLMRSGKVDETFDLFNLSHKTSLVYQKKLENFGALCLTKLLNKDYTFDLNDSTDQIFTMGLLTKHKVMELYSKKSFYECLHLSIMEFCLAYSLWRKYRRNWYGHKVCKLVQLKNVIEKFRGTSMICQFLSELMQNCAIHLFKQLDSVGCNFKHIEIPFWKMVSKLKESERAIRSIVNLVPVTVHNVTDSSLTNFYSSQFHANIIRNSIRRRKNSIWCVFLYNHLPINVPHDVVIPLLTLVVTRVKSDDDTCLSNLKNVKCNYLTYRHKKFSVDDDENNSLSEKYLSIFTTINAVMEKLLVVEKSALDLLIKSVSNGVLSTMFFDEMTCKLTESTFHFICTLLENDRIYNLKMYIKEKTNDICLKRTLFFACQSSVLGELAICNCTHLSIDVDLHQFGNKDWKGLHLLNLNCYCHKLRQNLSCGNCQAAIEVIKNTDQFFYSNSNVTNFNLNDKPKIKLAL